LATPSLNTKITTIFTGQTLVTALHLPLLTKYSSHSLSIPLDYRHTHPFTRLYCWPTS